jgi:hypothetical protein
MRDSRVRCAVAALLGAFVTLGAGGVDAQRRTPGVPPPSRVLSQLTPVDSAALLRAVAEQLVPASKHATPCIVTVETLAAGALTGTLTAALQEQSQRLPAITDSAPRLTLHVVGLRDGDTVAVTIREQGIALTRRVSFWSIDTEYYYVRSVESRSWRFVGSSLLNAVDGAVSPAAHAAARVPAQCINRAE